MGQHKFNPNCQLAKEGKLEPKPKPLGKRAAERLLYQKIREVTGAAELEQHITQHPYGGV